MCRKECIDGSVAGGTGTGLPAPSISWRTGKVGWPCWVCGAVLRLSESPCNVALPERAARPRGEYERLGPGVCRGELVPREDQGQLSGDRHRPRRSFGLCRSTVAVAVDLPGKRYVCLIEIVEMDVRPGETAQLRDPGTGQGGDCEERTVWLAGGSECLLDLLRREDRSTLRERELGPLRRQHQGRRVHAGEAEPERRELVDAASCAQHRGDRRLALALAPHVTDQRSKIVGGDVVEPVVSVPWLEVLLQRRCGSRPVSLSAGRVRVQLSHKPAASPNRNRESGATVSPRPLRARSSSRSLRAAIIPPSTVRHRWIPAASLKPTSSTPVGRR